MPRTLTHIMALLVLVLLPACGGGGGDGASASGPVAVVTLTLNNAGADSVGAVDLVLNLPPGFTLGASGVELNAGVLVTEVNGSYIDAAYQAETAVSNGTLQLVFLSGNRLGLFSGKLLSIRRTLSAGESLPSAAAFSVTDLKVADLQGNDVTLSGNYAVAVSVTQE